MSEHGELGGMDESADSRPGRAVRKAPCARAQGDDSADPTRRRSAFRLTEETRRNKENIRCRDPANASRDRRGRRDCNGAHRQRNTTGKEIHGARIATAGVKIVALMQQPVCARTGRENRQREDQCRTSSRQHPATHAGVATAFMEGWHLVTGLSR